MTDIKGPLFAKRIAVPESRQLDVLAHMLHKRGAEVIRCPLITIYDAPDSEVVLEWVKTCIQQPFDDLILLTGEGLRRLLGVARRHGLLEEFTSSLAGMCLITRGPKPGQALRQIGLKPDIVAIEPTTDGVIRTLEPMTLQNSRIGVQLYGDNPNLKLIEFLKSKKADVATVAPYRYAPDSDNEQVEKLINELISGSIDAITFTSQPQLKRLLAAAGPHDQKTALIQAMSQITIAAVGPVVAKAITDAGLQVDVMPESSYFMKPMVNGLTDKLTSL